MRTKYKRVRPKNISLDEVREKISEEEESNQLEFKLGLYSEIDTDLIGIRADLSRLFKNVFFTPAERRAIRKRLSDIPMDDAERKAFERARRKLIDFYNGSC